MVQMKQKRVGSCEMETCTWKAIQKLDDGLNGLFLCSFHFSILRNHFNWVKIERSETILNMKDWESELERRRSVEHGI